MAKTIQFFCAFNIFALHSSKMTIVWFIHSALFFPPSRIGISYIAAGSFEIENPALWSNWNEFSIFVDTFEREEETVFLPTWLAFNFGPRMGISQFGIFVMVLIKPFHFH